jgi:hypothetical protein
MRDHVHTGVTDFVFAGLAAIVMLHVLRIVAVKLSENPSTEKVGTVLGAFALAD